MTDPAAANDSTEPFSPVTDVEAPDRLALHVKMFGSHAFFRLWLAQVVSALGDWLGLLATTALAADLGGKNAAAAVALVMVARVLPGFFMASAAGVIVDRFDRKKIMVICDIGRAATLATIPFINRVVYLALASLVIEVFTGLWSPAKEATVPNLVPRERLATANSQNVAAAYGTLLIAFPLFTFFAKLAEWSTNLKINEVLRFDKQAIAIYFDLLTFLTSAFLISRLKVPRRPVRERNPDKRIDFPNLLPDPDATKRRAKRAKALSEMFGLLRSAQSGDGYDEIRLVFRQDGLTGDVESGVDFRVSIAVAEWKISTPVPLGAGLWADVGERAEWSTVSHLIAGRRTVAVGVAGGASILFPDFEKPIGAYLVRDEALPSEDPGALRGHRSTRGAGRSEPDPKR